jgi:hypothetical protein
MGLHIKDLLQEGTINCYPRYLQITLHNLLKVVTCYEIISQTSHPWFDNENCTKTIFPWIFVFWIQNVMCLKHVWCMYKYNEIFPNVCK